MSAKEAKVNPDSAAQWMAQQVLEQGKLEQTEAVMHLMQYRDFRLAYHNELEQPCVGRPVLRRFRSRFPDLRYDRRLKAWRQA